MLLNTLSKATWYPVLFDSPMNVARGIAFWLTVALALTSLCLLLLIKGERKKTLVKILLPIAIAYACAVALLFLILSFSEDGILPILFYPLLALVICVGASAVLLCVRREKPFLITAVALVSCALVATLVCMSVYFFSGDAEDVNGVTVTVSENVALSLCTVGLIAVIGVLAFFFGRNDRKGFDTKSIAYAAVCIAMSFALSYIRLVKMPQGGSVTVASLLPLMIYSYMFGVRKGVFAGFIYGLLQAIQDPWIVHPAQFLLDYPVAFAGIGVAGLFAKTKLAPRFQFTLGAIVASVLRYLSHIFSGVFAFSEYAYDSAGNVMNPWVYSLAYNSFVFIDVAIVIVVGFLVFSSASFTKQAQKYNFSRANDDTAPQ